MNNITFSIESNKCDKCGTEVGDNFNYVDDGVGIVLCDCCYEVHVETQSFIGADYE